MFKFLKNKKANEPVMPSATIVKTMNELVEEIHENFYTEVDRLLAEAKISKSLHTDKAELIEKRSRLIALGFKNTKEVKEAEAEIARLSALEIENQQKQTLVLAIDYFSVKYPNHKFITEESVLKICKKYNLIYGSIEKYIGTVPDKNLKHIEDFRIHSDDVCMEDEYRQEAYDSYTGRRYITTKFTYASVQKANEIMDLEASHYELGGLTPFGATGRRRPNYRPAAMEIAAPATDFNLEGMRIENFKINPEIEILDPVVLYPVMFNEQKHYLIVTAWGAEASDELVVNQKMN